jgi:hypothetical protein
MSMDDSKIEGLKKKLFSNSGQEQPASPRAKLQRHSVMVNTDWKDEDDGSGLGGGITKGQDSVTFNTDNSGEKTYGGTHVSRGPNMRSPKDRSSIFKKILGAVSALFVLALAFAGYTFYTGSNFVSNNNVDINLVGPVTNPAGEDLSLDVDITNRNSTDLILADLVITYPDGTRNADDRVTPLTQDRIAIGTLAKGQTVRETVRSVLFGEENTKKNIKVSFEYRIDGSSNIFVKDKQYPIFIGSSPISVNVDSANEVIPDQENEFKITIRSNSPSIIKGLVFKAEYPFGFEFVSAVPATTGDNTTWVLGDIQPGEERTIVLRGRILGGELQQRVFKFYTGTEDPADKMAIGTIFVTNSTEITLKKPFLSADIALDGKKDPVYVAKAGDQIAGEITWQNNLDVPINDAVIQARITGPMLDKASIQGDQGFYRSVDNTIVWDNSTIKELSEISAGAIGRLQFSFAALKPSTENNSTFRSQSLKVELSIHAKRLNEDKVPEEVVSNVTRTIKIGSDLDLTTRLVRNVGPFVNTGPLPPMPEQPSTYTVLVSLKNSYNTVKDVVYTATLPQYVSWVGQTYPSNSPVTYNADKRTITWQVGDMQPGIGYSQSSKDFAFQVSFLPSIGQVGATPPIVLSQQLSGKDNFTGSITQSVDAPLDTKIDTDPKFKYGDDKVGGADSNQ